MYVNRIHYHRILGPPRPEHYDAVFAELPRFGSSPTKDSTLFNTQPSDVPHKERNNYRLCMLSDPPEKKKKCENTRISY